MSKLKATKDSICKLLGEQYPDFMNDDEFEAIVTHFVFCPDVKPAGMSSNIYNFLQDNYLSGKSRKKSNKTFGVSEQEAEYNVQKVFPFILSDVPFPPPGNPAFTFIDLFAGIGGFRIAFQRNGGKCLFTSEWDKYAKQAYEANFEDIPVGDIRGIKKLLRINPRSNFVYL